MALDKCSDLKKRAWSWVLLGFGECRLNLNPEHLSQPHSPQTNQAPFALALPPDQSSSCSPEKRLYMGEAPYNVASRHTPTCYTQMEPRSSVSPGSSRGFRFSGHQYTIF